MNEICHLLNQYPLEKHYKDCEKYLNCSINWDTVSENIRKERTIYIDVSDVISLFPHLELDENYKLLCYLSSEYHGIWGRIAAIKNGDTREPLYDEEAKLGTLILGGDFKLPKSASPPMEAIYHDGTSEGYFEAVLCTLFLQAIPYRYYEQEHWNIIMTEPPSDLTEKWHTVVDITDWTPRIVGNKIIAFVRDIENGCGSSDGCDHIYLTQFSFERYLGHYHVFKENKTHSMYKNQINDDRRYNDKRHCCVCSGNPVLIAKEKSRLE